MLRSSATFLITLLLAVTDIHADEAQLRVITTTGDSIVYVTPDEVRVNFGIETFDPDLDRAKAANDERAARLVKAIAALGVERKHIQTDNLTIEISYRNGGAREGIAGYIARRMYAVKLTDTKLFERLIDAGLKNGANQLLGFDFRTTELRQYRDQARKMAIKAAKEKAIDLARELECGVGKPRTINESGGYFGMYSGRYNVAMAQNSMQELPPAGGDQGDNLPLGQIAVSAQVTVTFDLTDTPARPGGR